MISVIVVNYNKKDLLRKCLDSIQGQDSKDIEIIVIDNASKDGTVEMTSTYYPEIKLIWNTKNLLLCKAYNQGVEASKGNFILCLNNDVILGKTYLKEALSAIGMDTKIGMISGKILRFDKKTIDSTGLFLGRNRKAVKRGYGRIDLGQYEKPCYVFGVSGSCAFFRKKMLEDIKDKHGYFDERFGMYYEDLDLCWRANKKGWKAYYNPRAVAYHIRGGTAGERVKSREGLKFPYLTDELKKRYVINRYRCILKNDSFIDFLINLPFILWYELKIWCYFLLTKIFRHSII